MLKKLKKLLATLLGTAVVLGGFVGFTTLSEAATEQLTGAIFTTDSTCTGVDLNIYGAKTEVYLDGGPQEHGQGTGLPEGTYYVRVLSPQGQVVLGTSGDVAPITVDSTGNFVTCYKLWDIVKFPDGVTQGYMDSSNSEYMVEVSSDPNFARDNTKSDNFRVGPQEPTATPTPVGTPLPTETPGISAELRGCLVVSTGVFRFKLWNGAHEADWRFVHESGDPSFKIGNLQPGETYGSLDASSVLNTMKEGLYHLQYWTPDGIVTWNTYHVFKDLYIEKGRICDENATPAPTPTGSAQPTATPTSTPGTGGGSNPTPTPTDNNSGGTGGAVLGASTLGATGSVEENMTVLMIGLGFLLTAVSLRGYFLTYTK